MDHQLTVLGESGLRFFGKMSAANAHEIKNALAVINENAGLLEDLAGMAEKGLPLDPLRLKRLAATIKKQVARADHIAKSSNRFSHSVDHCHEAADLDQALALVTDMSTRFATLRDIHLKMEYSKAAIILPVRPFMLLHLLWLCLHATIQACGAGQVLTVSANRTGGITEIRYGPLPQLNQSFLSALGASDEIAVLLRALDSTLNIDPDMSALRLTFKKKTMDFYE